MTLLGFGNWKATVAALTGLAAKETVVATFGILYHNSSEAGLAAALRGDYSSLAAYSFLIFNLLCAPCFAAIGAIKREMANLKWTVGAIGFQTGLAYCVSFNPLPVWSSYPVRQVNDDLDFCCFSYFLVTIDLLCCS